MGYSSKSKENNWSDLSGLFPLQNHFLSILSILFIVQTGLLAVSKLAPRSTGSVSSPVWQRCFVEADVKALLSLECRW